MTKLLRSTTLCLVLLACLGLLSCGSKGNQLLEPGDNLQSTGNIEATEPRSEASRTHVTYHDVVMRPQEALAQAPKGASFAAPSGLLNMLPAPDGERDLSCLGTGWYIEGSSYDDALENQNVLRIGEELTDGEYSTSGASSELAGGSYAIYRWNLLNYSGAQTIGFNWIEEASPLDWTGFYVGLGNLQLDRWQFFEGPADGVLTLDSFGPYRAADGEMLMVVILLGEQLASLDFMEAGVAEQRATGAEGLPEGVPDYPLLGSGDSLPLSFDLSELCAPINDQAPWGSCTAFAVGDGAYNYELQQTYGTYGWDLNQARFRVSPKHLYIVSGELQGFPPGGGTGRWTVDVISDLVTNGVATELNAPYDRIYDNDWSAAALADAQVLEIEDWQEVPCNTWEGIETVKQVLARQLKVLPMQAWLDSSFFSVGPADVWYYSTYFSGGHAMCIVGYDDSRGLSGAFKVRNSWSDYWGDDGHVWIGYEAFLDPRTGIRCWTITEEYEEHVADYFNLAVGSGIPVSGLTASKGTNSSGIQLNWQQQQGTGSYTVLRDDKSNVVATVQAPASSWLDESITDGYGHAYWIQGADGPLSSPAVGYLAATPQVFGIIPKSGEEGSQISISAAMTGSQPLSYDWDFGAGAVPSSSTDARPLITLAGPGSYSCSLVIDNPLGSDTFNFVLEVTPLPTIISAVSGTSGFSGDTVQLDASFSGTPTSYLWDFGGGASPDNSSDPMPVVSLGSAGNYEASLEVGNGTMTDVFIFSLSVLADSPASWPMPGHDQRNSHQSPVNGPDSNNLRWIFNAQNPTVDSGIRRVSQVLEMPDGDILFSCGNFEQGGSLYRLGSDGSPVWSHTFPTQGGLSQPLLSADGNRVYAGFAGTVYCYDAGNGNELWTAVAQDGFGYEMLAESPNGQLYVALSGKWLMSLDVLSGEVVLGEVLLADKYNNVRFGQLAPNGKLFLPGRMGYDRLLISFDTNTNTPSDTLRLPHEVRGMAVTADGNTLIVTDDSGDIRALAINTCQELWQQRDIPGGGSGPCIMADGTIVVSNSNGIVSALDPLDGSVLWDHDLGLDGSAGSYPAIGRDGTIYLGGDQQRVYAIKDGNLLWESSLSESRYFNGAASIASDGTLYIGDEAGWLWAFGPGSGEIISRPVIDQVAPAAGDSGAQLSLTAYLDQGTAPLSYAWDFGGGATPNVSNDAQPLVTLGAIGSYNASVTVTNSWGTDQLDFVLLVNDPNAQPEWLSHKIDLFGQNNEGVVSAGFIGGKPALFAIRENSPDPFLFYYESSETEPSLDIHWTRSTISDDGWIEKGLSMAEFGGEPAVAYVYDDQTLRYSARSSGIWQNHDVKSGTFYGDVLSMASVNGLPAIAYGSFDTGSWPLGYAYSGVVNPDDPTDWQSMVYSDVNIDSARVYLTENSGKPQVTFITRDVSDIFHVTFAAATTASPTSNTDWSSHYAYSDINYRDRLEFSQYNGRPQLSFTLHGADDDLLYASATSGSPAAAGDWNVHTLHSGGQIDIRRVYSGGSTGWPIICWNDNTASPVGYALASNPDPQQGSDWQIEQYALDIQILAVLEVGGNPVLIALLAPDNELRYYCYK